MFYEKYGTDFALLVDGGNADVPKKGKSNFSSVAKVKFFDLRRK